MKLFLVWHFKDGTYPQVQGVFDSEELAQNCCEYGDCYIPIELNKEYTNDINSEDTALYKVANKGFIPYEEASH